MHGWTCSNALMCLLKLIYVLHLVKWKSAYQKYAKDRSWNVHVVVGKDTAIHLSYWSWRPTIHVSYRHKLIVIHSDFIVIHNTSCPSCREVAAETQANNTNCWSFVNLSVYWSLVHYFRVRSVWAVIVFSEKCCSYQRHI